MSTYREIIHMVLDQLKGNSDDYNYTELHIKYLVDKWRALLLKQRYAKGKHEIPTSNFQTLHLDLQIENGCCNQEVLKSIQTIPDILISRPTIYTNAIMNKSIDFVSIERFPYVGNSRFSANTIYATLGIDHRLYLKSNSYSATHLECIVLSGVFSDPSKIVELEANRNNETCEILEAKFPLEDSLIPLVIQQVVRELSQAEYNPEDNSNNAKDDIPELMLGAMAAARARNNNNRRDNNES